MKLLLIILIISNISFAKSNFDAVFQNKTLRLDFYHSGNNKSESIIFDELIEEGDWSGSQTNLIDIIQFGNYMFKVFDLESNEIIYSRGFGTLFQEWQSTDEAKKRSRIFEGTVTFPFPKKNVRVEIEKRSKQGIFEKLFELNIDVNDYFIRKDKRMKFNSFPIHEVGSPSDKLDIVFIPDGYTKEEMTDFKKDCNKLKEYLFSYSPFKEKRENINIWGVEAFSEESGTDIPADSIWKNTNLNTTFYTFDSERYLMTYSYHNVRDIASNAPYDQIYIVVNTAKYGGGAIYNYYATTAAKNSLNKQIFVHEFGHALAGLADEYGADATYIDYYPLDVEPWEANITTLVDFESKWKNLVNSDTPIPTSSDSIYQNSIGAFEGAGYVNKGVYRSTYNSIMRAFSSNEFNEVCKQTLIKIIDFYSK